MAASRSEFCWMTGDHSFGILAELNPARWSVWASAADTIESLEKFQLDNASNRHGRKPIILKGMLISVPDGLDPEQTDIGCCAAPRHERKVLVASIRDAVCAITLSTVLEISVTDAEVKLREMLAGGHTHQDLDHFLNAQCGMLREVDRFSQAIIATEVQEAGSLQRMISAEDRANSMQRMISAEKRGPLPRERTSSCVGSTAALQHGSLRANLPQAPAGEDHPTPEEEWHASRHARQSEDTERTTERCLTVPLWSTTSELVHLRGLPEIRYIDPFLLSASDPLSAAVRRNNERVVERCTQMEGWTVKKSKDGVMLMLDTNNYLGCPRDAVRASTTIDGDPTTVFNTIMNDPEVHTNCILVCNDQVAKINENVDVAGFILKPGFPITARQGCVARCATELEDGGILFTAVSIEHEDFKGEKKAKTVKFYCCGFYLQKLSEVQTEASLVLAIDPKGSLPQWLVKKGLCGVSDFLSRLKKAVETGVAK